MLGTLIGHTEGGEGQSNHNHLLQRTPGAGWRHSSEQVKLEANEGIRFCGNRKRDIVFDNGVEESECANQTYTKQRRIDRLRQERLVRVKYNRYRRGCGCSFCSHGEK